MTNRTPPLASLGCMLAAMLAPAQTLPDTYSVTATGEMGEPLRIRINRNGSRELIEWGNRSGDLHMAGSTISRRTASITPTRPTSAAASRSTSPRTLP